MYAILIYVLVGLVFEYFVTLAKNSQIIGYNMHFTGYIIIYFH